MNFLLKVIAVIALISAGTVNSRSVESDAYIMQTKCVKWGNTSAVEVFVSNGLDGFVYELSISRGWWPKPRPPSVKFKDVHLYALDQRGHAFLLSPASTGDLVEVESAKGGSTADGTFVLKSNSGMTPKAVKLAWDGITKVIPLEPVNSAQQPDPTLTKQIEAVLKDCEALSRGGARNAVLRDFTPEGGISTAKSQTFVSRLCPYIKIDVTFILTGTNQTVTSPTDSVKSISKPYIDRPTND